MESDPRVLKEKGDNDAIQEAAMAFVRHDYKKADDIMTVLKADKVPDLYSRYNAAIKRLGGKV